MSFRRTLRSTVSCTGIGLHSGRPARATLHPAPAGHGIRFVRTDLGVEVPATLAHLDGVEGTWPAILELHFPVDRYVRHVPWEGAAGETARVPGA